MIGSATLALIALAFAGLLGYQKIHALRQQSPLRIVFEGSASGLRRGGSVNFDGVQIGEIKSLKLDSPRKIVALVTVDSNAPIRNDTVVGVEFQGLTGLAAIALTGGAAAAAPVPLDEDGIPILTADLREIESIRDSLHNVDRILVGNQSMVKDALLNFETYTASLASKGDAIESIMRKADAAFAGIDSAMTKVDTIVPGLASGSTSARRPSRSPANSIRRPSASATRPRRENRTRSGNKSPPRFRSWSQQGIHTGTCAILTAKVTRSPPR